MSIQRFKDRLKDCLSRKKNNISHLKVSLEALFFWNDSSKQNSFQLSARELYDECSFWIHLCRNHLLWAFAARILWKTQPCDIFVRVRTAEYNASCNHDGSLEDGYWVPFFKLKFIIPTLRYIFCSPKPSKIYGESDFVSSVFWNKLGKYTFLRFKKRDFYF